MFRQRKKRNEQHAQSVLEYTIVLGIVSLVVITMSTMIKRFTQGTVKIVADQVGNQANGDQIFEEDRGFMEASYTRTKSKTDTTLLERSGERFKFYNDLTATETNTYSDLGRQDIDPYDPK